jgi:hypothetical protein
MSNGHAWGILWCPLNNRDGCKIGVCSTPKNPENHARHIRRDVDMCPHRHDEGENADNKEDESA